MATQTFTETLQIEVVPQDEVNTVAEVCINNYIFATEEQLINLYQALCVVQKKPKYLTMGVCINTGRICKDLYDYDSDQVEYTQKLMEVLVLSWQHYSDNECFPVPSGYKSTSAEYAYFKTKNKFDKTTKYGRLRHMYINHLKKELKNILKVLKNS